MKRSLVFFCLSVFCCSVFFVSCKKDDPNPATNVLSDSSSRWSRLKSDVSGACYSPGVYRVDPRYKLSYLHLRQYDNYSCSWTSYVICVGCIANAGITSTTAPVGRYPVTTSQVKRVEDWCDESKYMSTLLSYGQNVDTRYTSFRYLTCSSRERVYCISAMLAHLSSVRTPFLVISTRGVGHYRIVFSVAWTGNEATSTVYYMDCYDPDKGSFDANIQSMNLSLFLDKMIQTTVSYNMLFISPK